MWLTVCRLLNQKPNPAIDSQPRNNSSLNTEFNLQSVSCRAHKLTAGCLWGVSWRDRLHSPALCVASLNLMCISKAAAPSPIISVAVTSGPTEKACASGLVHLSGWIISWGRLLCSTGGIDLVRQHRTGKTVWWVWVCFYGWQEPWEAAESVLRYGWSYWWPYWV